MWSFVHPHWGQPYQLLKDEEGGCGQNMSIQVLTLTSLLPSLWPLLPLTMTPSSPSLWPPPPPPSLQCARTISGILQYQKDPYEFTINEEVSTTDNTRVFGCVQETLSGLLILWGQICKVLLCARLEGDEDDLYAYVAQLEDKWCCPFGNTDDVTGLGHEQPSYPPIADAHCSSYLYYIILPFYFQLSALSRHSFFLKNMFVCYMSINVSLPVAVSIL